MGFSLKSSFEDIKKNIELYMQKIIKLQNIPINRPNSQWKQEQLTNFFSKYEPIFLKKQYIDSKKQSLILKKYKNCVYFGHINNGKKQGYGVLYYYSNKIYEGTFRNDQKLYGLQIDQDQNCIYVGQFQKGLKSGYGLMKYKQIIYWGRFANNIFCIIQNIDNQSNNDIQQSKFKLTSESFSDNRIKWNKNKKTINKQGFRLSLNSFIGFYQQIAIFKSKQNDVYIGEIILNNLQQIYDHNLKFPQKNGQGLQIFTNDDLYLGNYQNNVPQGYGEYYWNTGAFYRGLFMSGMRHGKGKWQMLHGDIYQGIYLWKNGSKYQGDFQNDYRHGYGQMLWNDGRTYKGQWVNGIQKNVKIKLDNNTSTNYRYNTLSNRQSIQKVSLQNNNKRDKLPGVTKRSFRSSSNSNPKRIFNSIDNSHMIKKKIAIQNIKALYNPSNH